MRDALTMARVGELVSQVADATPEALDPAVAGYRTNATSAAVTGRWTPSARSSPGTRSHEETNLLIARPVLAAPTATLTALAACGAAPVNTATIQQATDQLQQYLDAVLGEITTTIPGATLEPQGAPGLAVHLRAAIAVYAREHLG